MQAQTQAQEPIFQSENGLNITISSSQSKHLCSTSPCATCETVHGISIFYAGENDLEGKLLQVSGKVPDTEG